MMESIKGIFESKKFITALAAVLGLIATGLTGTQEWDLVIKEIVGVVMAVLLAQGAADLGKEKAKVEVSKKR